MISANCEHCSKSFISPKTLKLHKARHHPDKFNLPIQDENEPEGGRETSGLEKDATKWAEQNELSLSNLMEKNSILKRQDNMTDFYVIDKPFDLNSMMGELFPE